MDILEKMREMLEAGKISKEDIERAFPKLKESEDERIRLEIHAYLFNTLHNTQQLTPRTNELERWLAYLEKQKESLHIPETCKENADSFTDVQKPAEWSEEDKEIIGNLRRILNAYAYEHNGMDVNGDYIEQNYIDADNWLKSLKERFNLQPHWKPSKKQIDALNSIILNGSFSYVGQTQDLISLKDDLKKQM